MAGKSLRAGRGRKPKNNKQKALTGSKHAKNNAPQFTTVASIDPPEWLDEIARLMWLTICHELCKEGVLTVTDAHNLEIFCSSYSNWRTAQQDVAARGIVLTDDYGKRIKNPAMTVLNESARQIAMFGGMLGLDPASRQRLIGNNGNRNSNPFLDL